MAGVVLVVCVVDVEWTVEGLEDLGDLEVFAGVEEETVVDSEAGGAWTEEVSEGGAGVAHPWMTWGEGEGEWAHLAKWT